MKLLRYSRSPGNTYIKTFRAFSAEASKIGCKLFDDTLLSKSGKKLSQRKPFYLIGTGEALADWLGSLEEKFGLVRLEKIGKKYGISQKASRNADPQGGY